jgi:DtxR family Mn-dependent transcriptional regulator
LIREHVEDYLGAIYRLRTDGASPVPLSQLGEYFGFSPVSVHEMVLKLSHQGWVVYHPYQGVRLTESGEKVAAALLRRHRLWERFLTDMLKIPWDETHEIAESLEHAAPESVTERLSDLLGDPEHCPHGGPIPPLTGTHKGQCLSSLPVGAQGRVTRISPESPDLLHRVQQWGLLPGRRLDVVEQDQVETMVKVEGGVVGVPAACAQAVWVEVL